MDPAPVASFVAGAVMLLVGSLGAVELASAAGAVCVAGAFLLALVRR